ncbi:hypothetical protein [Nocardia farcinica]|uniref:hypothetical protein n=1 Tax=Nocardia farcinica TaxID=37329 RepID=UPI002458D760|nr:hypothetical protein [Nocardia farcinica]
MSDYILTADFFDQIVERREDGTAKRIVKHRKGAIVSGLDEREVERLTTAGAIRPHRVPGEGGEGEQSGDGEGEQSGGETTADGHTAATLPSGDGDTPDDPGANEAEPDRPLKTAGVAEWRRYATALGMDEADAESMNRAELIAWADRR